MWHTGIACTLCLCRDLAWSMRWSLRSERHKWPLFAVDIFSLSWGKLCQLLWLLTTGVGLSPTLWGEQCGCMCDRLSHSSKGRAQWAVSPELVPEASAWTLSIQECGAVRSWALALCMMFLLARQDSPGENELKCLLIKCCLFESHADTQRLSISLQQWV